MCAPPNEDYVRRNGVIESGGSSSTVTWPGTFVSSSKTSLVGQEWYERPRFGIASNPGCGTTGRP